MAITALKTKIRHEKTTAFKKKFIKDVKPLAGTIDQFGNPFKEASQDLMSLETKDILHPEATVNLTDMEKIGKTKYDKFCKS